MIAIYDQISSLLAPAPFLFSSEIELQDAIARAFAREGIAFEREVHLGEPGNIDFMIGDVGIEIKVKGGLSAITRQLHRYAACERIQGLLLVTTKMQHDALPDSLNGKPLRVIHLIGTVL